eukprot:GHVU01107505.1.p1 GENE.GHVU01107505.1~~GHVU01107505.1.p1  ORF type:complete len:319 (-),score=58.20 GHVU01107505.1:822-1778(-)
MQFFKGRHTGGAIARTMREVLEKWNVQAKVVKILTDNAKNMIAAFENKVLTAQGSDGDDTPGEMSDCGETRATDAESDGAGADDDESDASADVYDEDGNINYDVLEGDDMEEIPPETMNAALTTMTDYLNEVQHGSLVQALRVRGYLKARGSCSIHSMQLAVKDFLEKNAANPALQQTRAWVTCAKQSSTIAEVFEKAGAYIHSPGTTRWDSLLSMILSVLEASRKVDFYSLPVMKAPTPTLAALHAVENLSVVMQIPRDFTVALEGEAATVGMVGPAVVEAISALRAIENERNTDAGSGDPNTPHDLWKAIETRCVS